MQLQKHVKQTFFSAEIYIIKQFLAIFTKNAILSDLQCNNKHCILLFNKSTYKWKYLIEFFYTFRLQD